MLVGRRGDVLVVNLEEEVTLLEAGHVGDASRIHVVQVLQGGAFLGRGQFHERRGRLRAPQDETEALPTSVQHHGSRFSGYSGVAKG